MCLRGTCRIKLGSLRVARRDEARSGITIQTKYRTWHLYRYLFSYAGKKLEMNDKPVHNRRYVCYRRNCSNNGGFKKTESHRESNTIPRRRENNSSTAARPKDKHWIRELRRRRPSHIKAVNPRKSFDTGRDSVHGVALIAAEYLNSNASI